MGIAWGVLSGAGAGAVCLYNIFAAFLTATVGGIGNEIAIGLSKADARTSRRSREAIEQQVNRHGNLAVLSLGAMAALPPIAYITIKKFVKKTYREAFKDYLDNWKEYKAFTPQRLYNQFEHIHANWYNKDPEDFYRMLQKSNILENLHKIIEAYAKDAG